MEQPYSNREIESHFQEIKNTLERIELQTCKTNGRVTKLESWRSYIAGAITIVTLLGGTVIGLSLYVYNLQLDAVRENLAAYTQNK
jgi:hypothetical protein